MKRKLLIVEDDSLLAEAACDYFTSKGWEVETEADGGQALDVLRKKSFHLILLDVMLPGMDGFGFCAAIRQSSGVPVIMMSARVEKEDKMNGFAQGADDYVEKPVDIDILRAKIGALMRRNYELKKENALLISGGLSIDKDAKRVFLRGKELTMTVKEYELLLLLMENQGRTLRKEYLFDQI